jgi:hypothetical protein
LPNIQKTLPTRLYKPSFTPEIPPLANTFSLLVKNLLQNCPANALFGVIKTLIKMNFPILSNVLYVKDSNGNGYVHVKKNQIFFGMSYGNYCIILTDDDMYYMRNGTFKSFLAEMRTIDMFRQVHRQYAIRIDYIRNTNPAELWVKLEAKYHEMLNRCSQTEKLNPIPVGKEFMEGLAASIKRSENIQLLLDL